LAAATDYTLELTLGIEYDNTWNLRFTHQYATIWSDLETERQAQCARSIDRADAHHALSNELRCLRFGGRR
jgi:hypothetical protein